MRSSTRTLRGTTSAYTGERTNSHARKQFRPTAEVLIWSNWKAAPAVLTHPGAWPRPNGRSRRCKPTRPQRRGSPRSSVWLNVFKRRPPPQSATVATNSSISCSASWRNSSLTAWRRRLVAPSDESADEWLDTRRAAEYLGVGRDSIRRLAAEGSIPTEQAGVGCKLFFRRSDLDAWRCSGSGPIERLRDRRHG